MSRDDDEQKKRRRALARTAPYETGYCKPPKSTRFAQGNRAAAGRRSRSMTHAEKAVALLTEKITVKVNGKLQKLTAFEAILHVLRQKALGGDLKSMRELIELPARLISLRLPETADPVDHTQVLREKLEAMAQRMKENEHLTVDD